MRLFGRKVPSHEKKSVSEQEVCPFLEYIKASGPGVYHISGLWCAGVSFRRRLTEKHATGFCLSRNYVECPVIKLIPTERKTSIKAQVWSLAELQKAKKWLIKHQRGE